MEVSALGVVDEEEESVLSDFAGAGCVAAGAEVPVWGVVPAGVASGGAGVTVAGGFAGAGAGSVAGVGGFSGSVITFVVTGVGARIGG